MTDYPITFGEAGPTGPKGDPGPAPSGVGLVYVEGNQVASVLSRLAGQAIVVLRSNVDGGDPVYGWHPGSVKILGTSSIGEPKPFDASGSYDLGPSSDGNGLVVVGVSGDKLHHALTRSDVSYDWPADDSTGLAAGVMKSIGIRGTHAFANAEGPFDAISQEWPDNSRAIVLVTAVFVNSDGAVQKSQKFEIDMVSHAITAIDASPIVEPSDTSLTLCGFDLTYSGGTLGLYITSETIPTNCIWSVEGWISGVPS